MDSGSIAGIIGLYGGAACGLFGWWFGRKKARKNRDLDEVYELIWQKARSYAWYCTLLAIYILFSFVAFGFELRNAMVLGILLIVHIGSWAISGTVLCIYMYSETSFKPSRVVIGLCIVGLAVIIFTVITIIASRWEYLLMGMPFVLFGIIYALTGKKSEE